VCLLDVRQYFVEAGAIAVRRVKKEDLKRIAKATGGQVRHDHACYAHSTHCTACLLMMMDASNEDLWVCLGHECVCWRWGGG
jgi:hypothetical protein